MGDENSSQGTPKTLNQAIVNGMCIGQMKDMKGNILNHVRDFLSQRFGAAMLAAPTTEEEARLKALFEEIVRYTVPTKEKAPVKGP